MSLSFALVLLSMICIWPPATATAAAYYVSPDGSNSNPGTLSQPWASPGFASKRLTSGDTLIILGGTYVLSQYWVDMITLENNGNASAWIVIKGEAGNRPLLVGRNNLLAAVDLSGRSYVRVENLEITHDPMATGEALYFRDGIDIGGAPAGPIVLKDLYIHHIDEMALNVQDIDDLQVINCHFEYCGFGGIGGPAGVAGGIRHLLVQGCRLAYMGHYYQGGSGSDRPYDRPDGLGLEPSAGPVEIVDTVSEHNYGDGLDSKAANTHIHHCVVANNSCDGIKLWADGSKVENSLVYGTGDGVGGASPWAGIVIETVNPGNPLFEMVNVTVHDNPGRQAYPMYVQYGSSQPLTLVLRNTIIANGSGPVYCGPTVNLTAQNNLFYRPGDSVQVEANGTTYTAAQLAAGVLGPGNLSASPRFLRPAWGAPGDYHLAAGSPGIDQGTAIGAPTVDLDYRKRPQGKTFDMGAYEFGPGKSTPAIMLPLLLE